MQEITIFIEVSADGTARWSTDHTFASWGGSRQGHVGHSEEDAIVANPNKIITFKYIKAT